VSHKAAQEISGISRATYFRYKKRLKELDKGVIPPHKKPKNLRKSKIKQEDKDLILKIRRENLTYGKAKIAVILKRDHDGKLSESSVGRVLKEFMEKGIIQKSLSALRQKKKRNFKKHAQRWEYGMKAKAIGEFVQIDHMTVTKNGISFKHFQAWDPISKTIIAEVYSDATSRSAKKFLKKVVETIGFSIKSIQVDGGSEFMLDFEEECKEQNIPLYVLPPRKPKYNGGVERGNRIFREEFYARNDILADSIVAMRIELAKSVEKYNTFRPHKRLNGRTPKEYTKLVMEAKTAA